VLFGASSATLEVTAIVITLLAHVVGAGVLIWALLDGDRPDWRRLLFPKDDDGDGGSGPDDPLDPVPGPGGDGGLPLPGAQPSGVRLREPGRLGDGYPRPPRRPEHVPERPGMPSRPS
jgi:hypothetical protein